MSFLVKTWGRETKFHPKFGDDHSPTFCGEISKDPSKQRQKWQHGWDVAGHCWPHSIIDREPSLAIANSEHLGFWVVNNLQTDMSRVDFPTSQDRLRKCWNFSHE